MQSVCPAKLQIYTATGQAPYLLSKGNQSFNSTVESITDLKMSFHVF